MLKYKLFKWFAGVVLVFGALSAALGIWVINQRIVQEAQTRVHYDLNAAWAVYQSQLESLRTVVRLVGARGPLIEACSSLKWDDAAAWHEVQGILGKHRLDFGLDFLTLVAPDGRVVARSSPPYRTGDYRSSDPLVAKALSGATVSGTELLSAGELGREADGLTDRAFLPLQEVPRARPTPRQIEDRGMTMMAAAPIEKNGRIVGAIYAGLLLNRNETIVEKIQNIVFGQERYDNMSLGTVTAFLGDTRVATTVRFANGNRAIGTRVSQEVADRVLDNGASWMDRAFVVRDWYLTAYDPIRDPQGTVIGMLYVGTLERPFRDLNRSLMLRYSMLVLIALVAALLIAMFIAGRLARPLHRLAEQADKMRHGRGFHPVQLDHCCSETAGLIQAFNEMSSTLSQRESQLKEANEQLARTNDSLKGLNTHYMETLQFVSHEMNGPLASIMNYTYMLRQGLLGPLTEKQTSGLGVMSTNLKHVMEMIRHYLNLARIESGEMQPVLGRVVVRDDVIATVLASLDGELHARNMRVEDLIGPKVILHADLNMIREVFENLLSNAVKYGRGGGVICLDCRCEGQWAEFAVRNEGEGIVPEKRGELFQKFSRIETGAKGRRGTGLGLFICRQIIQAHGGSIRVESDVGHWTEFRFRLPLADAGRSEDSKAIQEVRGT